MSFFKELKRRNVFRVGIAYTVATWLLIQVTDTVFPRIGLPDSAVTLVIALLAIGFIPALIFAWAFEMTPDGIKREKDVDRTQSITPVTGRKLDRSIILVLSLVVAWFLFDKFYLEPNKQLAETKTVPVPEAVVDASDKTSQSIAVLPFVNMSADVDNEYFSDGISEELLNVLAKIGTLHVASRTSAFAYKGKDLPLSQIARELKVENVLEGSVRKAGNRVRITAQLINAESDRHIWSETYERELVDIFEIQEEISNHIVDALKIALNVNETEALVRARRPTENTEAYELYLQGRYAWRLRHEDNLRKSIELFEKAIAIDPGFARAYEALAQAWAVMPAWSDVRRVEASSKAKPYALKALELDPALVGAEAILAEWALNERQWARVLEMYPSIISREPRNPTLHQWYAEALALMGYLSRALDEMLIAYDLDPASPVINQSIAWIAGLNHKDDLAIKHVGISKGLGVGDKAVFGAMDVLVRRGDWDTIFATLGKQGEMPPVLQNCMQALRDPSLTAQLSTELDEWLQGLGDQPAIGSVIPCLAIAGQAERAAELSVKNIKNDWADIGDFWSSNDYTSAMRQTKAFRQALVDMGLVEFYRENGWPDLCHPISEDDFKCD